MRSLKSAVRTLFRTPFVTAIAIVSLALGIGATAIEELETLPEQVRNNTFLDRMMTTLSAAFELLATLLAAIGLSMASSPIPSRSARARSASAWHLEPRPTAFAAWCCVRLRS